MDELREAVELAMAEDEAEQAAFEALMAMCVCEHEDCEASPFMAEAFRRGHGRVF
jgi:hypothetical protein